MKHEDECHLIKGLINAMLIEALFVVVLIGIGNILSNI